MTKKEIIEKYGEKEYQRRLEQKKQYNQEHRDEIKQYNQQYREQHRDERNQYNKQHYQQHKEKYKQYREQHIEKIKEYQKQYDQQRREQKKQYNQEHREVIKEHQKKYREQHRDEIKQRKRKNECMFAYCIPEQIEQIENYESAKKDNFDGWHIHHRLETHNSDGEKRLVNLSREELIALDMYYNRPANELVFLTKSEHAKLHKMKSVLLFV